MRRMSAVIINSRLPFPGTKSVHQTPADRSYSWNVLNLGFVFLAKGSGEAVIQKKHNLMQYVITGSVLSPAMLFLTLIVFL